MKLMLCYDGSKSAKKAIHVTIKKGRSSESQIFVIYALGYKDDKYQSDEELKGKKHLEYAKRILNENHVFAETVILPANPHLSVADMLVQYAELNQIDEILIGVTKKSKVGKFIFGSTAQHIILNAPCPVTTVK